MDSLHTWIWLSHNRYISGYLGMQISAISVDKIWVFPTHDFLLLFHWRMVGMNEIDEGIESKDKKMIFHGWHDFWHKKYGLLHSLTNLYSTHASITTWKDFPINPLTNIRWLGTKSRKGGCLPF